MDTSLWQTIGTINFLHSSHKWLPPILSCGQCGPTLSMRGYFKIQILQEILKTQNQHRAEFCAFSEAPNICTHQLDVRKAKREYLTAPLSQRSFRWMPVCVWMVYLRWIYGIWSLKCWKRLKEYQNQPKPAHWKPVLYRKTHPRLNKCWSRMWIYRT